MYTNNLYELLYNGHNWNREKTIEAYRLLDKIIWCGEFDIDNCDKSDIKSAFKYITDLLYSEATLKNEMSVEEEARDTIFVIAVKLKILSKDQEDGINNSIGLG